MILRFCPLDGCSGHDRAWRLLEEVYRETVGGALPGIAYGPRGKPDFDGGEWHFSLSHTRAHAVVALSRRPVGVDAEERDRVVPPRLAQRVLSPGELEQYRAAADPNLALLRFWVLKEASAKRSGEGLRGFPNRTAFTLDDPHLILTPTMVIAVFD